MNVSHYYRLLTDPLVTGARGCSHCSPATRRPRLSVVHSDNWGADEQFLCVRELRLCRYTHTGAARLLCAKLYLHNQSSLLPVNHLCTPGPRLVGFITRSGRTETAADSADLAAGHRCRLHTALGFASITV